MTPTSPLLATFFLRILFTLLMATLVGCAPGNKTALFGGEAVTKSKPKIVKKVKTLADLEEADITIRPQPLEYTPVEKVLESYREALKLFTTPEQRQQALRRMADLTMVATEDRLVNQVDQAEAGDQQSPGVAADQTIPTELSDTVNYSAAVELYKQLLNDDNPKTDRAEVYYLLAKAYDLNGEVEQSLATMNQLVSEFPGSQFHTEVQFRRGEIYFSFAEYEQATAAYKDVLDSGVNTDFYEHALYKQGWSRYKLNDFDIALNHFISLLDHLNSKDLTTDETGNKTLQKIKEDTYRVTSMTFAQLDGPTSAKEYFKFNGTREYESEVYKALATFYIRQERYEDAAETYQIFVQEHPLHAEAPAFTSAIIDVYTKGGFPSLILPVKEQFVFNYGVNSQYWKNASQEQRQTYMPELKKHLIELAQHYHANAQQSKLPKDYRKAALWYSEFLQTFPTDPDTVTMNKLLAETLFAAKDYLAAIEQFEKTAYGYDSHPDAASAGYFSLVAYQEFLKEFQGTEEQKSYWIGKRTKASMRFVQSFPGYEKNAQILEVAVSDQLKLNDLPGAIATSRLMLTLQPPASQELRDKAWRTIANGEFDLGHYPEAEAAIDMVLAFPTLSATERKQYQERMAASIYKQAEELRNNGKKDLAAEEFLRVGQRQPNSSIRANADYDAGTLFMETENWPRAIQIFSAFRAAYPQHVLSKDIPVKLALAYEKTGQLSLAAGELEAIAMKNKDTNPEMARQAMWQAAEYQEKSKNTEQATRLYKQYVWAFEEPAEQRVEGQYKLVTLYTAANDSEKRSFWLNQLIKSYDRLGKRNTPRSQYLAAYASYELAEPEFNRFKSIKLSLPLKKSLKVKKQAMQNALSSYTKTAGLGVAEFTTSSTHKIGEIYRILAKDLMASERPGGLSDLELEQYDILLEDQALPFEDQAIEIFETNTARTVDDIYDEWVKKSFSSLAELLPGRYDKKEKLETAVEAIY